MHQNREPEESPEVKLSVDEILARRAHNRRQMRAMQRTQKGNSAEQKRLPRKLGYNVLRSLRLAVQRNELTAQQVFQRWGDVL